MKDLLTLLIPTHNRHGYLHRVLDYYKDAPFRIIVADSSLNHFHLNDVQEQTVTYLHLSGAGLTAKLEIALNTVTTPYVAMCADDDFLIPNGIVSCIDFLQRNIDYVSAQGDSLSYTISRNGLISVDFRLMYDDKLSYSIADEDPFDRLEKLFALYRSIFYAVHRTHVLRRAFKNAGRFIQNLYLNEYLTAIIPVSIGKHANIPVLYQVREFSDHSDDKVTDNLNTIIKDEKYANEYTAYVTLLSSALASTTGMDKNIVERKIKQILEQFSKTLDLVPNASFKKKVGKAIALIPLVGRVIVKYNRKIERSAELNYAVRTTADQEQLTKVTDVIMKYAQTIS